MSKKDNKEEIETTNKVAEDSIKETDTITAENEAPDQDQSSDDTKAADNDVNSPKTEVSELDRLTKELAEMKDKYLRIFAEFDNYRKRTIKEKQDIIKLASRDVLNAVLPAVDDFDRAIRVASENENEAAIPEGIILIYHKLFKSLEQQGIKEMETNGQDFDPEMHEALTKVPAPNDELKGKIIDTIEKGYSLNDKIIRYAKVVVGE
jgi:molecular chaperone GrpE